MLALEGFRMKVLTLYALVSSAAWNHSRIDLDQHPEPRSHLTTKVAYPRRRKGSLRRSQTAVSEEKMAAGHGHVHNIEYSRQHRSDFHAPPTGPVDTAGVRLGLQLDLRHPDPRRTIHAMVSVGYAARLCRRSIDRHLRRDSLTHA